MILHCQNLAYRYRRLQALHDFSFSLRSGRILAVIGPNGAGKSTLLSLLARQRRLQTGSISTSETPLPAADLRIGWAPEYDLFYEDSSIGRFAETTWGPALGMPRRDASLRAKDMAGDLGCLDAYYRPVRGLSHGTRRKAAVIIALLERPDLAILDEPIAGLDVHSVDALTTLLRREAQEHGTAVVISDHRIDSLQEAVDDVLFIHGGKLIDQGLAADFVARYGSLVNAYRTLIPAAAGHAAASASARTRTE
jgi:ABC-2 type transport system ATP-binding protein